MVKVPDGIIGAMDMKKVKEEMKSAMIDAIRHNGAWFTTRKNKYVKIGFSEADNVYFARECFLKDGLLEGGAYSFGTDWFDISFHGKYIDIYVDPDTFRQWPVSWTAENGTCCKGTDDSSDRAERMLKFCRQADAEALAGIENAFQIDGTNFEHIISMMGESEK